MSIETPDGALQALAALSLTALPTPVIVVDERMGLLYCNRQAETLPWEGLRGSDVQRCGQLLSCVHARRDGSGCGETPRCPSCVLRRSALEAIRGQTTASCRAVICRETAQGPLDSHLLVTAGGLSWGGRRVAVVLLRDLPEVIANAGLVPVCAWCRRVCSDGGEWLAPGEYLAAHVTATHGMCPHCLAQWQANDTAAENPAAGNPAAGPPAP